MHRLSIRFTVRQIVLGSLVLTMIRWGLIAELTGLVPVLIFAQLLHAASYGALHAVSVQYIQGFFGKHHHGQGQALYSGLTFGAGGDRKSTRLNSSHVRISYAVFCLKKK